MVRPCLNYKPTLTPRKHREIIRHGSSISGRRRGWTAMKIVTAFKLDTVPKVPSNSGAVKIFRMRWLAKRYIATERIVATSHSRWNKSRLNGAISNSSQRNKCSPVEQRSFGTLNSKVSRLYEPIKAVPAFRGHSFSK